MHSTPGGMGLIDWCPRFGSLTRTPGQLWPHKALMHFCQGSEALGLTKRMTIGMSSLMEVVAMRCLFPAFSSPLVKVGPPMQRVLKGTEM